MKKNNNTFVIVAVALVIIIAGVYFWRSNSTPHCQEICFSTSGEKDCSVVCSDDATPAEKEAAAEQTVAEETPA